MPKRKPLRVVLNKSHLALITFLKGAVKTSRFKNLFIDKDGSTIAVNDFGIVGVEGVSKALTDKTLYAGQHTNLKSPIILTESFAKEIDRAIPKDTNMAGALEYFLLKDGDRIKAVTHDGRQEKTFTGLRFNGSFIDWHTLTDRIMQSKTTEKIILNFAALKDVMDTLHKLHAGYGASVIVSMEIKEMGIILRTKTKQGLNVTAILSRYTGRGIKFDEQSRWEANIFST